MGPSTWSGRLCCLFLFGAFSFQLLSQQIIVTGNGDRIVMYPDGSWRPIETGDSLLLRQQFQKSEAIGYDDGSIVPSPKNNPAEYEDYILRQWNELHFNILSQEKKVQAEFRNATNAQFKATELLANAEANKKMIDPVMLASLNDDYDVKLKELRSAKMNLNSIRKIVDQSKKLAGQDAIQIERKMNALRLRFNNFLENYNRSAAQGQTNQFYNEGQDKLKRKRTDLNKEMQSIEARHLTSIPSPVSYASSAIDYQAQPFECKVQSDEVDETTGRRHIVLAPALLFTHTDPDLRPYFKNKELITCYGQLTKVDAYVYLTIDFQIASSHSQSNFGSLQQGSLLRLRLLNGENVTLHNLKSDKGRIDPYSGHTVFTGQYALGKDEIKLLTAAELDKVRILWSTGYEDYDVYKVDFFRDQLHCLMNR